MKEKEIKFMELLIAVIIGIVLGGLLDTISNKIEERANNN